ncbi:hypothetical protein EMMF5_004338 [Cystobasidiomycetes sp. EMM_F5]
MGPRVRLVRSISEADLSIYNFCRAGSGTVNAAIANIFRHRFRVVISNDSDYAFVMNAEELQFTISYCRWYNPTKRLASKSPYTVTNLAQLPLQGSYWPWVTDEARWLTTLATGHDYMVGGLRGLGLTRLANTEVSCGGTVDDMIERLRNQAQPPYRKAAMQLEQHANDFEAALAVFRTGRHIQATPEQLQAALDRKDTKVEKKRKGSPHVNIELRFKPAFRLSVEVPRPTAAQSIPYSRRPCKTGNLHMAHKTHTAWVYDDTAEEQTRMELMRPDDEPAWRHGLDDNKTRRRDRLRLQSANKGFKPKDRQPRTDAHANPEQQNAQRAADAEDRAIAAEETEETDKAPGGKKLQLVGDIYPIRSHRFPLVSSLQAYSAQGIQQKDKVFQDVLRLHCFSTRLVMRNFNELFRLYMLRLITRPENAYLATWRFAYETKSSLEGVYRGFLGLLMLNSSHQLTVPDEEQELAKVVDDYAEKWARLQQPGGSEEDVEATKAALIDRLRVLPEDLVRSGADRSSDVQTDIVMLEVMHETSARQKCPVFPVAVTIFYDCLKKVRTPWLRQARRAPYIATLDKVFGELLGENASFIPTQEEVGEVRGRLMGQLRDAILSSTNGMEVDDIAEIDEMLAPITAITRQRVRQRLVEILELRTRFVPDVPSARHRPTLDDILFGRYTSKGCPAKFAVPLFGALGHDFTVDYKPTKIPLDTDSLWWLVKNGVKHMENLARWLREHWIEDSLRYPQADGGQCINLHSSPDPTILETLSCFQCVSLKDFHVDGELTMDLSLKPAWTVKLKKWIQDVTKAVSIGTEPKVRAHRTRIFDAIFLHKLPRSEIWAGTLELDGEEVIFRSIDVTRGYLDDKLLEKVQSGLPRDITQCRADRVLLEILKQPNTFCTEAEFRQTDVLGNAYRHDPRNSHPQKERRPNDRNVYKIMSTLEWLSGRSADWHFDGLPMAFPAPNGTAASPHGRRPFVRLTSKAKEEGTQKGLPKTLKVLNADSVDDFRRNIFAAMFDENTPYDDSLAWLSQLRIAGDDLGDIAPNAIGINSPALPAPPEDDMVLDAPPGVPHAHDTSVDTSITMVMKATGLQELIRQATVHKQDVRNHHFIRLDHLRQHQRYCVPFSDEWRMHAFHEELVQSSTSWLMHTHLSKAKRRSYEDRFYQQFKDLVFPTPASLSRPVLFLVGDSCGFSTRSSIRHTAAFANPLYCALRKKCMDNRLPVIFALVDEAFSSQVCPNPKCINERHPVWREGVVFDKAGQRCAKGKRREAPEEETTPARSRLFKAYYKGTLDQCQRILQCETCRKVYHRDAAAGMNIAFIGWHILRFRRHPWRTEAAGQP